MKPFALGLGIVTSWLGISSGRMSHQALGIPPLLSQRSAFTCPAEVETLTTLMLRDLPNYANRVIQRARRLDRSVDIYSYVIVAGQAEFEPLSLDRYLPLEPSAAVEPPEQVFFTTLERQYQDDRVFTVQNYHWLFLVNTERGWRLSMIYTRFGSTAENRPPLPPRESSQGVMGQAVSLWLRDCRAGTVRNAANPLGE